MPRVTNAPASRERRRRALKAAKGYHGARSKLYRTAVEAVRKAWLNAFNARRKKKGDFRRIWITRIGIAVKQHGFSYSKFMHAMKLANIKLDRKMLSEIAISDEKGFNAIVDKVKS
jgi:large subunit ribosomal protein L20